MAREVDQFHGHKGGIADEGPARLVPMLLLVLFSLFFVETVGLDFPPRCLARHASSNENNRHADHSEDGNGDEWSHVRHSKPLSPRWTNQCRDVDLQCHGRPSCMCSEGLLQAYGGRMGGILSDRRIGMLDRRTVPYRSHKPHNE